MHPNQQVSLHFVSKLRFGFFDCVHFRSAELARDRPWHRRRPSLVSSSA